MDPAKRNQLKTRYGPGFCEDQNGSLHVSTTELLEAVGLPETRENMDAVRKMVEDVMRQNNPDVEIIHRATPED